jgi:hypothetical protein
MIWAGAPEDMQSRIRALLHNDSIALIEGGRLPPKDTDKFPAENWYQIIPKDAEIEPNFVDAVSQYYAGVRTPLTRLDATSRGRVLTNLAVIDVLSTEIGKYWKGSTGVDVELPQYSRHIDIDDQTRSTLIPDSGSPVGKVEPARSTENQQIAAPKPRYASVQLFKETAQSKRGAELSSTQPLKEKGHYIFEISVRLQPKGIRQPLNSRPLREPRQARPVSIVVTAESDDFRFPQPVSSLILPPEGDSTTNAVFRATPIRKSQSAEDMLRARFKLFYRWNLLEVMTVRAEAVGSLDNDDKSSFGSAVAATLNYEPLRQGDLNDFDTITPACLHIYVEPDNSQFRLTFTLERTDLPELALVAPITLTPAQLEVEITRARKSLWSLCSSETLGRQIDGDKDEFSAHLSTLSDRGGALWSTLFQRGDGQAITTIGKWLQSNPLPIASKIQVSIEEGASSFLFAWSLLYDKSTDADTARETEGFWGLRYVIEQRVLRTANLDDCGAPPSPTLEIGAMYWKFSQTPKQQEFLSTLSKNGRLGLTLALGKPIDDAASARDYLLNCKSQIIYFFTHGYTGLIDGERYGVTIQDFKALYESLPPKSETKDAWTTAYENISQREFKSADSWIELSYGRIELTRLYQDILSFPTHPVVLLNMCDSAQITPSLSQSFIDFFLTRGASVVVGTECSMRPVFADYVGRELLTALFNTDSIGEALRRVRVAAAERRNLLGLAYTLFGRADSCFLPYQ